MTEQETMTEQAQRILVIGCVSNDVIHLEQHSCTLECPGGAGFYTAQAAAKTGIACTLLAPRPPDFDSVAEKCKIDFAWIGPQTTEHNFPYLEIRQHGNDRATLVCANWGAESLLNVDSLPPGLSSFAVVHIAALSSASRQLDFLKSIRAQSNCKISVGTYARVAVAETREVRELVSSSDYAFMNENESNIIFDAEHFPLNPRADQLICVTRGRLGASIYTSDAELIVPGIPVQEFNPTGAGDTFAGTMLASLLQNHTLQGSAELAIHNSSQHISRERGRPARFEEN